MGRLSHPEKPQQAKPAQLAWCLQPPAKKLKASVTLSDLLLIEDEDKESRSLNPGDEHGRSPTLCDITRGKHIRTCYAL